MLGTIVAIMILFVVVRYLFFAGRDKLQRYKDEFGLKKANLVYVDDYQKIQDLILPVRDSVFSKSEPVIWLCNKANTELFLGANDAGDLRVWFRLKTALSGVHIVLDSTSNDLLYKTNLQRNKLPAQLIELEGDYSKHFNLYCNQGQQIIALQIIAPDVMSYMLDNLLNIDIEIMDDHIALISRGGAKTREKLSHTIELAHKLDKLARAVTKVTTM